MGLIFFASSKWDLLNFCLLIFVYGVEEGYVQLGRLVGGDCKDIEGFFHYRCAQKRKTVPLLANVSSFPSQNAIFLISPFYLL
ncbi:hypothetical protein MANES_15G174300v8 [Manihot esculenta]|uniref:Uncharacterized protein n=1 Tax=Manihot esculenta TaxID=3983 RepID=A0ACB7GC89_MANES|nr:hypothetical protein MANES_15G174300v8 [Manihot esculenta]